MEYMSDIRDKLAEYDADVTEWDGFDTLDGGVYKSDRYHIGIKSDLSSYHKRFVICHELGHIKDGTVWVIGSRIAENRCDDIAVDMLVADEEFLRMFHEHDGDCDYLCPIFGVSKEVLDRKYKKLFPQKVWGHIVHISTSRGWPSSEEAMKDMQMFLDSFKDIE